MVSIPKDIAEKFGTVDGEYLYYSGWKYKIISHDVERYIANPIGRDNN